MALMGSLTSGVSALQAFAKGIEVIGNNVANVNTTGYKGSQAQYADSFSDVLQESVPSTATTSNVSAMQVGTGVELAAVKVNFGQGTLAATGVSSDLGIAGNGYFRVHDTVSGNDYATRAGDFRVDDNGYLVTNQGLRVQGLDGGSPTYDATGTLITAAPSMATAGVGDIKIDFTGAGGSTISMNSYSIDQYGNVNISLNNGDSFIRGRVLLQNFSDPSALMKEGNNLYSNFQAAGPVGGSILSAANNSAGTNGLGKIQAKTLELSNVDLSAEFANLITAQRSFQAGSRIITVSDSVLEEITNLKR